MRLSYVDLLGDKERHEIDATVTTDHAASSYGIPVVVLPDGESLDVASWILLNYQVEDATPEEFHALRRALSPYTEPLAPEETIRTAMSTLGKRTSPRKARSSAANGRKGGRPRKQPADGE